MIYVTIAYPSMSINGFPVFWINHARWSYMPEDSLRQIDLNYSRRESIRFQMPILSLLIREFLDQLNESNASSDSDEPVQTQYGNQGRICPPRR